MDNTPQKLENKIAHLNFKDLFPEQIYETLIELGRTLPSLPPTEQSEERRVIGCQSQMFLLCRKEGDKLFFTIASDALISKGIGALLVLIYSGESAETILKYPPAFLAEMGITTNLSPGRSNGLASLYLKMKQEAVASIMRAQK